MFISNLRGLFLVLLFIIKVHVLNANSEDIDQTPHSAASDLGLHCLPMSILWDARHIWVNEKKIVVSLFYFYSNSSS